MNQLEANTVMGRLSKAQLQDNYKNTVKLEQILQSSPSADLEGHGGTSKEWHHGGVAACKIKNLEADENSDLEVERSTLEAEKSALSSAGRWEALKHLYTSHPGEGQPSAQVVRYTLEGRTGSKMRTPYRNASETVPSTSGSWEVAFQPPPG